MGQRHPLVDLGDLVTALPRTVFTERGLEDGQRIAVTAAADQQRTSSVRRPQPGPRRLLVALPASQQRLPWLRLHAETADLGEGCQRAIEIPE
jgi:hypothetical protein